MDPLEWTILWAVFMEYICPAMMAGAVVLFLIFVILERWFNPPRD